MQKFILTMMVVLASYQYSQAQSLKAISQSGTEEIYSLSQPLTVTFDSSSYVFSRNNTLLKKWGYGELRKIVYTQVSTSVDEVQIKPSVEVFPQPIEHQFTVSYTVPQSQTVRLDLYSMTGEMVYTSLLGEVYQGENKSTLTIPQLPSGQYILCLMGSTFSYNIPLIHIAGQ
jgi:Secretion system C-terminal sorting domain